MDHDANVRRGVLRRILYLLLAVEAGFALAYLVIESTTELPWGPLRFLPDLDEEVSIPTWFSTVQLFLIGMLLIAAAVANRQRHQVPNYLLYSVAAVFMLLSIDEGAMVHERVTAVARRLDLHWMLFGTGRGGWILPYLLLALAVAVVLSRALTGVVKTHPRESLLALAGGVVMAVGAAGLEIVSYYTVPEAEGWWYEVEVAAEELLEMAGASVILYSAALLAASITRPAAPAGGPISAESAAPEDG